MTDIVFVKLGQGNVQIVNKGYTIMKKYLLGMVGILFVCNMACAGYTYTETETVTTWERADYNVGTCSDCGCDKRFVTSRDVKPCAKRATVAAPVRVKTHTEVIEHYQVYQPVTVYKPMGTEIQRRIVPVKRCDKCGL